GGDRRARLRLAAPARPVAALLEARGVCAAYGATPALDGVDAVFGRGELVAILGENGSGKSTFLKVIARIVPARAGDVFLEGRPLDGFPRRATARRIAYLPQSTDLVFPIRCLHLVLQGRAPHARGLPADSADDRDPAAPPLQACDVEALAERDASALSGGETRRVFLARALAQEAERCPLAQP